MSAPTNPLSAAAPAFTGITIPDGPGSSLFNSVMASLNSQFGTTVAAIPSPSTATAAASPDDITSSPSQQFSQPSNPVADSTDLSQTTSQTTAVADPSTIPTTLVTSSVLSNDAASTTLDSGGASTTAAGAASTASGQAVSVANKCNSISCSSGLQAAIAVPVVVGVLAIVAFMFFCMRRRRRRRQARDSEGTAAMAEKRPGNKNWSRHLRMFSFDAELLMAGRHSSSNSLRSRETQSLRSGTGALASTRAVVSHEPSLHSIDEAAPPYRPALSTPRQTPPSTGAAAVGPSPLGRERPMSGASAPPPYRNAGSVNSQASQPQTQPQPQTPTTARNPFSDSALALNADSSPFSDPTEDRNALPKTVSRESSRSRVRGDNESGVSSIGVSEAPSIHEAQVVRSMSVGPGSGKAYVAKVNRISGGSGTGSSGRNSRGSITPPKPS